MDIASVLGLIIAAAAIVFSVVAGGGGLSAFVDVPSLACVLGGCLAALLMSFPLSTVLRLGQIFKIAFTGRAPNTAALIAMLVRLAETARREGLLALEDELEKIRDPFVVLGVQLAVDGARPEVVEEVLRTKIAAIGRRHQTGKNLLDQLGRYGPAFGMVGTLLGLVIMLGKMSNPDEIGSGMAVALLTTLYGALLANAICLPASEKLSYLSKQEAIAMEIALRGILAIQSGDHPRLVEQKLNSYLPQPSTRPMARAA